MIRILYSQVGAMLTGEAWNRCFLPMPESVRTRISRYRRWEDRQAGLFGKLLLAEGLARFGHSPKHLDNLVRDAAGRPFLNLGMDFNISHSGDYVVCAMSPSGRLGIDIEQIRPIDVSDFKTQMTRSQWEEITVSENRIGTFFRIWTQKEAVAKADGIGIAFPLDKITIAGNKALLGDKTWEVNEVGIADGYCCHLASSPSNQEICAEQIFFG